MFIIKYTDVYKKSGITLIFIAFSLKNALIKISISFVGEQYRSLGYVYYVTVHVKIHAIFLLVGRHLVVSSDSLKRIKFHAYLPKFECLLCDRLFYIKFNAIKNVFSTFYNPIFNKCIYKNISLFNSSKRVSLHLKTFLFLKFYSES